MSQGSGGWYVRARGRILGPFTWAQLESLRDRGQLARFHEVSQDRQTWMGATNLSRLFAESEVGFEVVQPGGTSHAAPDPNSYGLVGDSVASPPAAAGEGPPAWFFARDGTHHGPIQISELRRMAASGEINPSTQVWTKGMPSWLPGQQVPELRFGAATKTPSGQSGAPYSDSSRQNFSQPSVYQPPPTSGLAIASLVLGIVWLCGLGSLLAIIFGAVALGQISRSRGQVEGKGLAIAGLVLGILGLALFALPFFTSFLAAILHQTEANRF